MCIDVRSGPVDGRTKLLFARWTAVVVHGCPCPFRSRRALTAKPQRRRWCEWRLCSSYTGEGAESLSSPVAQDLPGAVHRAADNPFEPVVIRGRVVEWLEGDAAVYDLRSLSRSIAAERLRAEPLSPRRAAVTDRGRVRYPYLYGIAADVVATVGVVSVLIRFARAGWSRHRVAGCRGWRCYGCPDGGAHHGLRDPGRNRAVLLERMAHLPATVSSIATTASVRPLARGNRVRRTGQGIHDSQVCKGAQVCSFSASVWTPASSIRP